MQSSLTSTSATKTENATKKNGGMETKLRETKLKLENSGEMRHTLVLWNQIISAIFRVQAWETKLK
jgi:hypothetical protein